MTDCSLVLIGLVLMSMGIGSCLFRRHPHGISPGQRWTYRRDSNFGVQWGKAFTIVSIHDGRLDRLVVIADIDGRVSELPIGDFLVRFYRIEEWEKEME